MIRRRLDVLTVVDVLASPELAPLAVLESAADIARLALIAAYPSGIHDDEVPVESRAASAVIDAAGNLATEIARYRLALARARERDRDDLLPF
jgi:hypothetical protein